MPFTSDDLARIDAAIAAALSSLEFQDRRMNYPAIEDLQKRRMLILNDLSQQSAQQQVRVVRTFTDSGF